MACLIHRDLMFLYLPILLQTQVLSMNLSRDRATWGPKGAMAPACSKKKKNARIAIKVNWPPLILFFVPINTIFGPFQQKKLAQKITTQSKSSQQISPTHHSSNK